MPWGPRSNLSEAVFSSVKWRGSSCLTYSHVAHETFPESQTPRSSHPRPVPEGGCAELPDPGSREGSLPARRASPAATKIHLSGDASHFLSKLHEMPWQ